jgi:hypothetical protein
MVTDRLFPILIPSKGRPSGKTSPLLSSASIPHRIVVEPQDHAAYADANPSASLVTLPEDNRGLAYVRNFILDLARSENLGWFWMMDDDIDRFFRVRDGRCHQALACEIIAESQRIFGERDEVAQAAMEYQQFAWSSSKSFIINSYCDVSVCIHSRRIGRLRYREKIELKEDRDFTLQLLSAGWGTIRTSHCAFSCPKNGSNAGGLSPVYARAGREAAISRLMVETWGPEICHQVTKPDGRQDVSINWRYFHRGR